ncbi:hypothetical protein [Novosphingobium umbonatum]|nr:hypothetical protein [Novosphingobium umbonatum]
MRFDFRSSNDINAERVALFSPAERLGTAKGAGAKRTRHPSVQLLDATMRLAGPHAELLSHAERPWASTTFSGARHTVTLMFSGEEGVAAAREFIATLPEHEFTIRGQLVADAGVNEVTHVMQPTERMVLEADLLVLAEV